MPAYWKISDTVHRLQNTVNLFNSDREALA